MTLFETGKRENLNSENLGITAEGGKLQLLLSYCACSAMNYIHSFIHGRQDNNEINIRDLTAMMVVVALIKIKTLVLGKRCLLLSFYAVIIITSFLWKVCLMGRK